MAGFLERVESGAVFSAQEIAEARGRIERREEALGARINVAKLTALAQAEDRLALMLLSNRVARMLTRQGFPLRSPGDSLEHTA